MLIRISKIKHSVDQDNKDIKPGVDQDSKDQAWCLSEEQILSLVLIRIANITLGVDQNNKDQAWC